VSRSAAPVHIPTFEHTRPHTHACTPTHEHTPTHTARMQPYAQGWGPAHLLDLLVLLGAHSLAGLKLGQLVSTLGGVLGGAGDLNAARSLRTGRPGG